MYQYTEIHMLISLFQHHLTNIGREMYPWSETLSYLDTGMDIWAHEVKEDISRNVFFWALPELWGGGGGAQYAGAQFA